MSSRAVLLRFLKFIALAGGDLLERLGLIDRLLDDLDLELRAWGFGICSLVGNPPQERCPTS